MAQNTATSSTDLLIRFLHIVIILSFTGAYLTGDAEEWHQVHMAFGYTLGISLILRILWQFLASRFAHTQPSGASRRFNVIKPFVQRYWAQPQQWLSPAFLKAASSSLFQLSILGAFCLMPLTVLAGFLTDYTHSHSLKEVHELFANLFLATVLLHLTALTLNSVLLKKWLAKRMFWGTQSHSWFTLFASVLSLGVLVAFWFWYFS
ncbi:MULTISPECIES: cytochrome b/b6 domain-containing protein [Acinetobacter]|jgi:cytochrome b|uniref:Cytochrome b/b6 domain-containing protein n=7 Tax=Acinetobacter TaxID=469 RepID=A0ABX9U1K8_9GAMM|nr:MULTISPECIES: cytochrome b/b6 domain-containing protein [Acinetobacter]MDD4854083.1 cytochrome b/b6 domain-containing protein [Acinetobacter towneri]HAV4234703.1 cytochrome b/b6 domain-containing protein [Acinetobacter baumannii ATCC 17978]EHU1451421.1 cytochrome b/b6 domain-containing protein [Acinetobacter baumannii]EHU1749880.1 cytochrome b/b6 domain-containing protein [Acinetobacter baumannii]EHU1802439.1 cytochrome b/b6 domain-containing protein [Acinetobacter baumannii]